MTLYNKKAVTWVSQQYTVYTIYVLKLQEVYLKIK